MRNYRNSRIFRKLVREGLKAGTVGAVEAAGIEKTDAADGGDRLRPPVTDAAREEETRIRLVFVNTNLGQAADRLARVPTRAAAFPKLVK